VADDELANYFSLWVAVPIFWADHFSQRGKTFLPPIHMDRYCGYVVVEVVHGGHGQGVKAGEVTRMGLGKEGGQPKGRRRLGERAWSEGVGRRRGNGEKGGEENLVFK